mmetsp:Transcript_28697/g.78942  ORF Transcript_28697/g.78942 Transcript_28697/m.78942 type:complete len:221 (-) Transcript_28697:1122-1784(-)
MDGVAFSSPAGMLLLIAASAVLCSPTASPTNKLTRSCTDTAAVDRYIASCAQPWGVPVSPVICCARRRNVTKSTASMGQKRTVDDARRIARIKTFGPADRSSWSARIRLRTAMSTHRPRQTPKNSTAKMVKQSIVGGIPGVSKPAGLDAVNMLTITAATPPKSMRHGRKRKNENPTAAAPRSQDLNAISTSPFMNSVPRRASPPGRKGTTTTSKVCSSKA